MTRKHGWVVATWAFAATAILTAAGSARAQEDCATCHEDQAKAFAKTGHGRYFNADPAYQSASCVSCHTGAQEHAASGGEQKPPSLKRGADANASCLSCHAGPEAPGVDDAARANYAWDARQGGDLTPVGAFPAGHAPDGLWDMAGNIWEWCRSAWQSGDTWCHDDDASRQTGDSARREGDAAVETPSASAVPRVVRGGSWLDSAVDLRAAYRPRLGPESRSGCLGFRVVCRRVRQHVDP